MPRPLYEVEGVDEIRREIRALADKDLAAQLRETNKNAAQIVVDYALPNVPVLTGRLRQSVRALGSQTGGRAVAGKGSMPPYAPPIHWGWPLRGIPRRPFLLDAAARHLDEITAAYDADINRLMDRVRSR